MDSFKRSEERRYETPTDLFERWSDETRRVTVDAKL